jgi:hypothetical protein
MIKLATAPDEAIATMWAGVLEQEGIRCLLKKTDPLSVAYSVGAGPMSVDLYVNDEDADRARETLGFEE